MTDNPINKVMTVAEAARLHEVSLTAIEQMIRRHWKRQGKARKANGIWIIDRSTVMAYTPKKE